MHYFEVKSNALLTLWHHKKRVEEGRGEEKEHQREGVQRTRPEMVVRVTCLCSLMKLSIILD